MNSHNQDERKSSCGTTVLTLGLPCEGRAEAQSRMPMLMFVQAEEPRESATSALTVAGVGKA